jgi:putative oxidoreductase
MGKDVATLLGRILIALLFVPSGLSKITHFQGTVGYITAKGLPMPEVAAAIAIFCELGLGLLVLVGWKARWAALALAVFTLAAGFCFHNFWSMSGADVMANQVQFFKNTAIAGGFLFIYAFGPGRLSVDKA